MYIVIDMFTCIQVIHVLLLFVYLFVLGCELQLSTITLQRYKNIKIIYAFMGQTCFILPIPYQATHINLRQ